MRSTYFKDEPLSAQDEFSIEEDVIGPDARGFLAFSMGMLVVYAVTSRPVLYRLLKEWISQLLRLLI